MRMGILCKSGLKVLFNTAQDELIDKNCSYLSRYVLRNVFPSLDRSSFVHLDYHFKDIMDRFYCLARLIRVDFAPT